MNTVPLIKKLIGMSVLIFFNIFQHINCNYHISSAVFPQINNILLNFIINVDYLFPFSTLLSPTC